MSDSIYPRGMGVVYIIENEYGFIKIGISINPKQRLRCLETQSGNKIKRSFLSPICNNYRSIEKELHKKFSSKSRLGEWFAISFEDTCIELNSMELNTDIPKIDYRKIEQVTEELAMALGMPREFKQFIEENPGARPTMNDLFQLRMRKENPDADVHCQWCLCPKSVWKASNLKTYKGNECKLFSYFFDVIWDLDNGQPFTFKVVVEKCKEHFLNDPDPITDISDWDATVKEMILEDNEIIPKTFSWE